MVPNPHDPWKRTDLSANEKTFLDFTANCLHGDDLSLIEKYVSPTYIQHTAGVGQGREGILNYIRAVASKRPNRKDWRPIQIFSSGDYVILHKLLTMVVIVDIVRFDENGMLAEHWDVVQPLPEPDYDPMRLSTENHARFAALFNIDPNA